MAGYSNSKSVPVASALLDDECKRSRAFDQANALAQDGDFEGALPLFRAAFHGEADDAARIAESFSQCCLALDKSFSAAVAASTAVELNPQWSDAFLTLARGCWESGKATAEAEASEEGNAASEEVMAWIKRSARFCELAVERGFDDMEEISEDIVSACRPLVRDIVQQESWSIAEDSAAEDFQGKPHAAGPGAHIWTSGEVLAAFLWAAWPRFLERNVLELGAGSGVVSLILAWRLRDIGAAESKKPQEPPFIPQEAASGLTKEKVSLPAEPITASAAASCVDALLGKLSWPHELDERTKRRRHDADRVDIVATDLPGAILEKLEVNIWGYTWSRMQEQSHCSLSAAQLRWEECASDLKSHVLPRFTSADNPVLVLGADIIYNAAQVPVLVKCLQVLFGGKESVQASKMLLGHQSRSEALDTKMLNELDAAGFVVKQFFDAKLPFQEKSKHIKLFEIKPQQ